MTATRAGREQGGFDGGGSNVLIILQHAASTHLKGSGRRRDEDLGEGHWCQGLGVRATHGRWCSENRYAAFRVLGG